MIGKDDIQAMLDRARGSMGDMADTLIAQQGLAAARAEYEQLGYDLDAMQMDYLAATGAKMLGLAALGMAIAVMVGFLASRTAAKVGRNLRERCSTRWSASLMRDPVVQRRIADHARHQRRAARADGHRHAAAHGALRAHPGHRRHHHDCAHRPVHGLDHHCRGCAIAVIMGVLMKWPCRSSRSCRSSSTA